MKVAERRMKGRRGSEIHKVMVSRIKYAFLIHPWGRLRSIVMSTSVCLSVHEDNHEPCSRSIPNFFVHVAYGCSSVLLQRCNDTLLGFVDDITFFSKMGHIMV